MPLKVYNRSIGQPMQASSFIVVINCAIYVACALAVKHLQFSPSIMFQWGAVSNHPLVIGQHWRLVTAGFLHYDLLHLLFNMMWIISFGSLLEKRVGATNFLLIYLFAVVFGNIFIKLAQPGLFAGAGASGAVSGIMGAFVCLQVLRKPAMSPQTLITNLAVTIGFNVAFASSISWRGHLGGFVAGLIACATLDLVERFNRVWLTCKFPEFIKLNLLAALPAGVWLCRTPITDQAGQPAPIVIASLIAATVICIKLFDFLLARKNGLVVCILALSMANMAAVVAMTLSIAPQITAACVTPGIWFSPASLGHALTGAACTRPLSSAAALGFLTAILTVLLFIRPLKQGFSDVGFIPAGFRAARRRANGL